MSLDTLEKPDTRPLDPPLTLPPAIHARFNGDLADQTILAWSPFDLDEHNHYADHHAVLTDQNLLIVTTAAPQSIPLAEIEEATISEGLGVDSLSILAGGKRIAELRYTRHVRRPMTRLHRKLQRQIGRASGRE